MTRTEPTPAGWYVDPTGRHKHRYWDGTRWSASVSDAGVTATDEPDAAGAPTAAAILGYRAVAVRTWRVAALYTAEFLSLGAAVFEALASTRLRATPSDLGRWAWLYHETPGVILYGYPPLGLWVGLLLVVVLPSAVLLPPAQALKKAGCSVRWTWSAPDERARLRGGLHRLGFGRTVLRSRGGRTLIALAEVAALLVVGVSAAAVFGHSGMLAESEPGAARTVGDLSAGLGPRICLLVGLTSALLLLLAWPWGRERRVLILRDGTVRPEA